MDKTFTFQGEEISRIALGCMRMGALAREDAAKVLETAIESGIRFFDHADIYGGGDSEKVFAQAMKDVSAKRENIFIQSKCAIHKGMYDWSKEYILESVDKILQRLDTDYLDVLLLHRPDTLFEVEEVSEAFHSLETSGKVRNFGLSNVNQNQIALLQSGIEQKLAFNQLQFSLLHAGLVDSGFRVNLPFENSISSEGLLEYCRLHEICLQAWSPLQHGFIEGTFLDNEDYPEINAALSNLAKAYGVSKIAIALAWILRHPAKMQVLLGSMGVERIKEACKASDIELTRREWYDLYIAAGHQLP